MSGTDNEELRERLAIDLRTAMKAGDRTRTRTIRGIMAAIDNAEAAPARPVDASNPLVGLGAAEVARNTLDRGGIAAVLAREAEERDGAVAWYRDSGRTGDADRLAAEATIIRSYAATLDATLD